MEGTGGQVTLPAGEYLDLANSQSPYNPTSLPNSDSWDNWNQTRDRHYDHLDSERSPNIPDNIGLVGDDLGDYGTWHDDPAYGHVWAPRVSSQDWRPYRSGHWTWVDPFGWTWVASEPWGWVLIIMARGCINPMGGAGFPDRLHNIGRPPLFPIIRAVLPLPGVRSRLPRSGILPRSPLVSAEETGPPISR